MCAVKDGQVTCGAIHSYEYHGREGCQDITPGACGCVGPAWDPCEAVENHSYFEQ